MKTLLAVLLALPVLAWGATTYTVVKPSDCTAVGVPSSCCQANNQASQATCNLRNTAGQWTMYHADLRTSASGNTYTAGGDVVPASTFGLGAIVYATCYGNLGTGLIPQTIPTGLAFKLQLLQLSGVGEFVGATNNFWFTCDVYGR